jgi:hypothetical protein
VVCVPQFDQTWSSHCTDYVIPAFFMNLLKLSYNLLQPMHFNVPHQLIKKKISCNCQHKNTFVMKINLMHYLSLIYFITQPLRVSGICCPSSGGIHFIYTAIGTCYTLGNWPGQDGSPSYLTYNMYQLLYIYSEYLLMMGNICPKHVEVE